MLPPTVTRSGYRHLWTARSFLVSRCTTLTVPASAKRSSTSISFNPALASSRPQRFFSSTPAIYLNNSQNKDSQTTAARSLSKETGQQKIDPTLLSADDDLMVGNEGLETIDPKDFPELYPRDSGHLEGLDQADEEAHDFEELETINDNRTNADGSVLLSDKARTEEEFSWFVDESYQDKATTATTTSADSDTHTNVAESEEGFIPLWQKNAQRTTESDANEYLGEQLDLLHGGSDGEHSSIAGLVDLLESERARNVKVIDMRDKCDWTNWMVIAEGLSERHLGNVADQVYRALKKSSPKSSPPVMEGRDTTDWVVIDAGSVVIHFMTPEARKERDLEGLWASVKSPLKLKDAEDITWEDVKGKMTKAWKENPGRSRGEDGKRGRRGERDIPLSEVVKW